MYAMQYKSKRVGEKKGVGEGKVEGGMEERREEKEKRALCCHKPSLTPNNKANER